MSEHAAFRTQSFDEYAASPGVSATELMHFKRSPAHAKAYRDGHLDEETDALNLGTMIHAAFLTPDQWRDSYHVKPEGMRFSTKEGKAWRKDHQDKPIVTADEYKTITGCVGSLIEHPFVRELLTNSAFEQSCFVDDDGLPLKCRFDAWSFVGTVITDLKTAVDASEEVFSRVILNRNYHIRAGFYRRVAKLAGFDRSHYVFIVVEKTPPYAVAVPVLDRGALRYGEFQAEKLLEQYRACRAESRWPAYQYKYIQLPGFEQKEADNFA